MDGWTSGVYRRRYLVVLTWVAIVSLALAAEYGGFGPKLADLLSNRFDLPGTESAQAQSLLQKHFHERDDSSFTVVFQPTGSAPVDRAAAEHSLDVQAKALGHGVLGPLQEAPGGVLYAHARHHASAGQGPGHGERPSARRGRTSPAPAPTSPARWR